MLVIVRFYCVCRLYFKMVLNALVNIVRKKAFFQFDVLTLI